jgi:hypothetical protein
MLREALKQLVRAGFSPNPDASVMMSPNATGLQEVFVNKITKKFATPITTWRAEKPLSKKKRVL